MRKLLFNRIPINDLEKSLDAYSQRQKAISNNISNVNTPDYKAQKVTFEKEYKKALNKSSITGLRNNEKHIKIQPKKIEDVRIERKFRPDRKNDSGLNNVDIDFEMAQLAENSLRYKLSVELLRKRFTNIKSSIKGR